MGSLLLSRESEEKSDPLKSTNKEDLVPTMEQYYEHRDLIRNYGKETNKGKGLMKAKKTEVDSMYLKFFLTRSVGYY